MLYAVDENSHKTASFCLKYDEDFRQLPVRRDAAVTILTFMYTISCFTVYIFTDG